jgi:tungstate transport system substrate-binding protein
LPLALGLAIILIALSIGVSAVVVFVHDKPSELKFVADGFGVGRREVMYNDVVLVGPTHDPAGINGGHDIVVAFRKIAAAKAGFVSRGDDSGTDKAEKRLWQEAAISITAVSGTWYRDTGSGMGPTLNTAAALDGYALSDRGTWLSFQNRRDLRIVVEGASVCSTSTASCWSIRQSMPASSRCLASNSSIGWSRRKAR